MTLPRRLLLSLLLLTGAATAVLIGTSARGSNLPQLADLAARVMPAVVSIASTDPISATDSTDNGDDSAATPAAGTNPPDPSVIPPPKATEALGSGFVFNPAGYILTNNHVIAGASNVTVTFQDGTVLPATIVGRDTTADFAVLKVDAGHPLPFLSFGDSNKLRVGDWVLAIGNPFGMPGSASAGIVSALHRDISQGTFDDFIQTDAAINSGNSGGPLFNTRGQVIGVNAAIYSPTGGSVGLGFAIPSAMAAPVANAIMTTGAMNRGWLGAATEGLTPQIQTALDLPSPTGALVGSVSPNSPAAGKLRPGDVITVLAGTPIASPRALLIRTAQIPAGNQATIKFWRDGGAHSASLLITAPPPALDESIPPATPPAPASITIAALGLSISTTPANPGVSITAITPNSPASKAGLLAGNIIEQLDGQPTGPATLPAQINTLAQAHLPAILLITGATATRADPGPRWVPVPLKK